ncbi:MAG: peptide ABC transporter substrate-binding protein, partial [Candidatus Izemoplasmatales bacterium]
IMHWNIGADPKTLDPGLNGASDGGDVINNTFEGLVREKNGEVLPGMAESWTVSTDGLTYTFNIRSDAKWSDGSKLTADDFVRSWLRGMDPRNASEYSWIWEYTNVVGAYEFAFATTEVNSELDALAALVGIKSLEDGAKFEVKLTAPTNWFVSLMAFYHFMPVPAGATIEGDGAWAKDPATALSNGPFHLTSYTVGDHLILEKNDNYWNADEVGIEKIKGYFIDLSSTAYAKYVAGEMDVLNDVPSQEIPNLTISSTEFYNFPLLGTYYANFNLSGSPEVGGDREIGDRDISVFYNLNLRKALNLSIDRQALVDAVGTGAIPAAGFIPKGFMDHNGDDFYENAKDDSEIVADDSAYALAVTYFEAAAEELYPTQALISTEAAVEALRAELATKEYLYNTNEAHQQVGELIQEMWAENLGFTIKLGNEEWATFQDTRTDGNYDISRGGWLTDFMDPSGMIGIFTQGNAYNDPDYFNQDFEDALAVAREATTAEAHFNALYEAHEIFMADLPIIPIYHYSDVLIVDSRITGWSRSVLGSIDFSTVKFAD